MAISPDTRLGVYDITAQIGEGGMGQVYQATDTNQISTDGGRDPLSSPDGRQIFYNAVFNTGNGRYYDITPDGKRFLVVMPPDAQTAAVRPAAERISVVLNWFEELKQRVPVEK